VLHVRVLVPRRQRPALVGEQPASLGVVGVSQLGGDAREAQRVRVDVTRRAVALVPARQWRRMRQVVIPVQSLEGLGLRVWGEGFGVQNLGVKD